MWVCFNDAFISIVEDKGSGLLKVRARKKKHLKVLFPGEKILTTKSNDYRFRVFVRRETARNVVSRAIMGYGPRGVTYDNFKNSVKDPTLHDLYADFWVLHNRYQYAGDLPLKTLYKPPRNGSWDYLGEEDGL